MEKISVELTAQQWQLVLQSLDELPRKVSNGTWVDLYTQLKAYAEAKNAGEGTPQQ